MPKIVLLESDTVTTGDINLQDISVLKDAVILNSTDVSLLIKNHQDVEILLINKYKITKTELDQLPNLKMIQVLATGYDNVDLNACKERGIKVFNVSGYSTHSVAQHVFALILAITNKVHYHWQMSRDGIWSNEPKFCFYAPSMMELRNKQMGIIGMGNIGNTVAEIAHAYGMDVCSYTRSPENIKYPWIESVALLDLVEKSDIISLHVPLTEDTSQMVDEGFLSNMKSSGILINTARGGLIDEDALYNSLNKKEIKAAGLDVLQVEPPEQDHPLLSLNNCIVTSHMAWATLDARLQLLGTANNIISDYLAGKEQNYSLV
ncbi:NAD(P)-dependent oxidoreductase [Membranihabitans marinus]|uniref:NAD(P)-dependent oxidoreductase n=1 Tax=Membranihabitans marinus TaxID=1227546 RepID=UPI001F009DC8|nr:NAD(P)-dependent oxidoreductase [Membranihabitans marinus]